MNLSGSEDESDFKLTINKSYAAHYEKSRRSEELMKLKARYGDVKLNGKESESDSETEDEDAEELTPALEQKWLKALAALKSNDPSIYDKNVKFFGSEDEDNQPSTSQPKTKTKKKAQKKVTLKDIDRKVILERDGQYSDESDSETPAVPITKGYYEEQDEIKRSFKQAEEELSSSDDEFLKVREKTPAEKAAEEEEYIKFIKGQDANLDQKSAKELSGLREFWNRDDMTEDDKFLREYILGKKYRVQEDEHSDGLSSSDEEADEKTTPGQLATLSDLEDEDEKTDQFERKYNFRFEEPDPEFIKAYPRTIESSMRSRKSKRKEKRAEVKERKDKEKEKRRQELNRLKNLKRQEIEERLEAVLKQSGANHMPFTGEELDDDFNPEEHDKKMKEMFPDDGDYDEDGANGVMKKPVFEYDPEIDDAQDWDKYKVKPAGSMDPGEDYQDDEEYMDIEDPNFNMDADYDPNAATLDDRNFGLDGRSKKSRRKKNRLQKALERSKPLFNPADKTFDEYLDEYYGMEYEDMIGDLRCRFPYREVPANDFGLSVGEILGARDKELNAWSSLKKAIQYRSEQEEYKDIAKFRSKGRDIRKKKLLLPSLFRSEDEVMEETNNTEQDAENSQSLEAESLEPSTSDQQSKKKQLGAKKRKAKKKYGEKPAKEFKGMEFSRMEAFGLHKEVKRVKKLRSRENKHHK